MSGVSERKERGERTEIFYFYSSEGKQCIELSQIFHFNKMK